MPLFSITIYLQSLNRGQVTTRRQAKHFQLLGYELLQKQFTSADRVQKQEGVQLIMSECAFDSS